MVTNITKMLLIQMPMALKDPADELQVQFQKHWLYSSHLIASAANAGGSTTTSRQPSSPSGHQLHRHLFF